MKFGTVTYIGPLQGIVRKIMIFFENPTWRRRHVENHKNCDISSTVLPIFTKSGTLMQNGSLNLSYTVRYKIEFQKSKMAASCHSENRVAIGKISTDTTHRAVPWR